MSGRMTELWHRYEAAYEAFRLNVNHPDEWESNAQTFEALTAARQAILDEGLKEYQALRDPDGEYVWCRSCQSFYQDRDFERGTRVRQHMITDGNGLRMGCSGPFEQVYVRLAAVRESQVNEGGV